MGRLATDRECKGYPGKGSCIFMYSEAEPDQSLARSGLFLLKIPEAFDLMKNPGISVHEMRALLRGHSSGPVRNYLQR